MSFFRSHTLDGTHELTAYFYLTKTHLTRMGNLNLCWIAI